MEIKKTVKSKIKNVKKEKRKSKWKKALAKKALAKKALKKLIDYSIASYKTSIPSECGKKRHSDRFIENVVYDTVRYNILAQESKKTKKVDSKLHFLRALW